jgi:hypothetical protein
MEHSKKTSHEITLPIPRRGEYDWKDGYPDGPIFVPEDADITFGEEGGWKGSDYKLTIEWSG